MQCRKQLVEEANERQRNDWARQVKAMEGHSDFASLLPGGTMLVAMDVTKHRLRQKATHCHNVIQDTHSTVSTDDICM